MYFASTFHKINHKINKTLKGVNLHSKMQRFLPRWTLLTIKIIYKSALELWKCSWWNDTLATTCDLKSNFSREKLYAELGLTHIHHRRWMRRVFIWQGSWKQALKIPKLLFNLLELLKTKKYIYYYCRTGYFQNSF